MSWKYRVWHVGNGYIAEHDGYATKKDAEEYGNFSLECFSNQRNEYGFLMEDNFFLDIFKEKDDLL